ncbi:MAG TPA: hypothetical protein VFN37_09795 [Candidatus Baltobacteraceae bacterium]|nr:hypothetical protein [Candidatus Baltobacteraceae bacterium]
MAHRSHRHSVPTARPPAQALGVLYMWGRGEIGSALRGYLHDEHAGISEHDDVARKLAVEHGCPLDLVGDAWAWRVDRVSPHIIDLITRDDASVLGWTQFQREMCPPSLALRNALNAVTSGELANIAGVLAERFAKSGPHTGGDPHQWIAADNRIVFFDADAQEWRLGGYAGA